MCSKITWPSSHCDKTHLLLQQSLSCRLIVQQGRYRIRNCMSLHLTDINIHAYSNLAGSSGLLKGVEAFQSDEHLIW